MILHLHGVDPGLVHTGIVYLGINTEDKELTVVHQKAELKNAVYDAKTFTGGAVNTRMPSRYLTWVEDYRPRKRLNTDVKMLKLLTEFKQAMPYAIFLDNTGIKKVVKDDLLKLFGLWDFDTVTHHQDLRSAARIMVLGALKDPEINAVLSQVVRDHLDGNTWEVDG